MFGQLIATLKKSPKTIVFTEGTDPRILEASARLLSGNFLKPVLVGNPEEIAAAAEDAGFNIRGALECVDQANLYNKYKKHRKNDRSFSFHVSSVCGLRFVSCLEAILPHFHTKAVLSSWRYLGLLRSCSA